MAARSIDVRRSALVAHPAERLFAIIEAAEDYPAFLPWCGGATILERDEQVVAARIQIAWRGVRFSFVTRNPKRPPLWMAIGLEEGPFRRFDGQWNLTPLSEWGCRVEFRLSYEMNSAILSTLAGPVFDHAVNTLVDAFIARADQVAAGLARVSTERAAASVPVETSVPPPESLAAAATEAPVPPPDTTAEAGATPAPASVAPAEPENPPMAPSVGPTAGPASMAPSPSPSAQGPAEAPAPGPDAATPPSTPSTPTAAPDGGMIENPDERKP